MDVLLICQDVDEQAVLALTLQRARLRVNTVQDAKQALTSWSEQPADMIILVQRGNPVETVQELRAGVGVPLVLIVGALSEDEKASLYSKGADLLLTRPYSIRLLMNQIPALLRRTDGVPPSVLPPLTVAEIQLCPDTRTVQVTDQPARRLAPLEFNLLCTLMSHPGQVLTADRLIDLVWNYRDEGDVRLPRNLVWRVRKKIEPDPQNPRYILTIADVGYTFQP